MVDTIREKILDNIKTALDGISIVGGYVNNIASVQKYAQQGNDLSSVPCAIISAGQENKEHRPSFIVACSLTVLIDVYTIAPTDTDASLNSLLGDVEKALMVDYTRGGIANNTKITQVIPFESTEGQPYCGLIISVDIDYYHKSSDSTQQ